ncbi:MAG: 3-phosphoshikimate 1-carboxyvinyltransferase [Lachnospiraceae bacterium]|jgi:3-phosphoshikimate 1-carboxyvinyltransferase
MNIKITPGKPRGVAAAPPSKSYAHRMLICGALAGDSSIRGISGSEDISATVDCLAALGAHVRINEGAAVTTRPPKKTEGILPEYKCRESGSTLRFFIPLALALTGGGIFYGSPRLIERGIGVYEEIFAGRGIHIEKKRDCIIIRGSLEAGEYRIRGDMSSQFITGMLMALPLLGGDSVIEVLPPVESRPYIDITLDVMDTFAVKAKEMKTDSFSVKGGQSYLPCDTTVEGDWSNAAFLFALKRLHVSDDCSAPGMMEIIGLNAESIQGDRTCLDFFDKIDLRTKQTSDISACPDLGPVLFAYAAAKGGGSFTGIKRLRIKESDRVEAMARELGKFGIATEISENGIIIKKGNGGHGPCETFSLPAEPLDGHNDHRIVMAVSVLATLTGGVIQGAEAVRKSYPDFFETLKTLGISLEEI